MKAVKFALMMGLLLLAAPMMAQDEEETLFGSDSNIEYGGFGAPVAKFTKINGKLGVLAGLRAGWIVDHVLSLGVGGYYLVNNVRANAPGARSEPYLNLYYGGLEMELILASNAPVHLSLHSLVGAGAVGTRFALFSRRGWYRSDDRDYHGYGRHLHHHSYDPNGWEGGWGGGWWSAMPDAPPPAPVSGMRTSVGPGRMDAFFVVEPGANLDFNMTHDFRLSLGGSYRWVKGVRSAASTGKLLSGPSAMVTFRFGSF
jgi:hypothetical protein